MQMQQVLYVFLLFGFSRRKDLAKSWSDDSKELGQPSSLRWTSRGVCLTIGLIELCGKHRPGFFQGLL